MAALQRTLKTAFRRSGPWAWVLVVMVLVQTFGLMHGVTHGHHAHGLDHRAGLSRFEDADLKDAGWLERLFASHELGAGCQSYDQSSHGDCMPTAALPAAMSQALGAFSPVFEAAPPPVAVALVQARGPPVFR